MSLVYASQLSDEPVEFKWFDRNAFLFSRNMHLLLCDTLAIPLTGIVSNPFWHMTGWTEAEIEAQALLFSGGTIRPVAEPGADAVKVVEQLLRHPEHHWLPTGEQMLTLAQTIRDCSPKYEPVLADQFRAAMYDDIGEILARLDHEDDSGIVQVGSLADLRSWHHAQRDERDAFRLSALWTETKRRFTEGSDLDICLRAAGAASYHYQTARQMHGSEDICAPSGYLRTIDMLLTANSDTPSDLDRAPSARQDYTIDLPLDAIADFPLSGVVGLRTEDEFVELRNLIRRIPGTPIEEAGSALQDALDECYKYLAECNVHGVRNAMRRRAIEREKNQRLNKFALWGLAGGTGVAVLGFMSAGLAVGVAGSLLAVFAGTSQYLREVRAKSGATDTCQFPKTPDTALDARTLRQEHLRA